MNDLPTALIELPATEEIKEQAQELANEMWPTLKPKPYAERMALIVLALKDMGLPTAHLRFIGGGGPDEWEWWEDEDGR